MLVVEAPELNVLATIRRAGPEGSSHLLRINSGDNRVTDYLIVGMPYIGIKIERAQKI